ncbi:MAG: hypothetical protein AAF657_30595, partial [Acidobacteriota bacterium]
MTTHHAADPSPATDHSTANSDSRVDDYLRRLGWALSPLPEADRAEIVAEARSHLLESASRPGGVEAAARALGEPESYARSFLENYEISASLGSGSPWRMLATASRLVGRGLVAFFGMLFFFVLYTVSASLALVALLKPVFPDRVGMWTGERVFALGFVTDVPSSQEHLGYWIVPLCLAGALLVYRLATRLLQRYLQG